VDTEFQTIGENWRRLYRSTSPHAPVHDASTSSRGVVRCPDEAPARRCDREPRPPQGTAHSRRGGPQRGMVKGVKDTPGRSGDHGMRTTQASIGLSTPSETTRPPMGRRVSFDWAMVCPGGWLLGASISMAGPTTTSRPPLESFLPLAWRLLLGFLAVASLSAGALSPPSRGAPGARAAAGLCLR